MSALVKSAESYRRVARQVMGQATGADFVPPDPTVLDSLPADVDGFYDVLGHFMNSYTGQRVPRLAPFQRDCFNDIFERRFCMYPKSQKIGMTALFLMQDIFLALTRDRGREIFIVSQNVDKAVMHLGRLKNFMRESPTLAPFLIERPPRDLYGRAMRDINSTTNVAAIWNPDRPRSPSLVIACGINNVGGLISNVNVGHIHMSDISAAVASDTKVSESFAAARTRLVNTRGTMVVETPPSGDRGLVAKILYGVMDNLGLTEEFEGDGRRYMDDHWLVRRLHYRLGIEHGLFDEDVIAEERAHFTPGEFARFYEASLQTDEESAFRREWAREDSDEATNIARAFQGA